MIPGLLQDANVTILQALVTSQIAEGLTIEYKAALPGGSDSDRIEFLADVSSFANTSGGDIIYGITEESGFPVRIAGTSIDDQDAVTLRMESMIRDGISPRLPRIDFRAVRLEGDGVVLAIRIPRSWNGPHRVTFKNHGHFYARSTAGKYRLDVDQLRAAFVGNETVAERLRAFRFGRIAQIKANELPVRLTLGPKLVLHVLPLASFALGPAVLDVRRGEMREFAP